VATAWPAHAADGRASKLYEDALTRYEKRDLAGAILQLKSALQIDRRMLPVHVLLGKALLDSWEYPAAEAAFDEALQLGVNRIEVAVPLARAMVGQGKQLSVLEDKRLDVAGLPADVQTQLLLIRAASQSDLGDVAAALRSIQAARAASPSSAETWLAEVPVRVRARQYSEAMAAADRALAIDPKSGAAHYSIGSVRHAQGNTTGALAAYDKALALDPLQPEPLIARAGILIDQRKHEAAARDVATLVDKWPNEPRAWYLSALLAEREGRHETSKAALTRITELLDPIPLQFVQFRPQALMLNGQAHLGLGGREKAKLYFEAFQRVQPNTPVSKVLASIYLAEGSADKAIDALDPYLKAHASDSQAMALLASAHIAKGRHARAADLMHKALKSSDAPELYAAYGLSLLGSGQSGAAVAQLESAYRKDPGQTQAAVALVTLYLRTQQAGKAMAVAADLVRRQPSNPAFQNLLGVAKAGARDTPGARSAFEQAIRLDPGLAPARIHLARLESDARNFPKALKLLEDVLQADPNNTEALFEQAQIATRVGKPEDALRLLQRGFDVGGTKDLRTSLSLVDLHLRSGRTGAALKAVQQLSAAEPENVAILIALARVQLTGGDPAAAKTVLTSASRLAPVEAPVQTEVASLQLLAGDVAGAAYALDKALSAQVGYMPAQVLMTEVELRQGEYAKAEARAEGVLRKLPKAAIGHSLKGDIALARKQTDAALAHYRKAHQVQPSSDTLSRLFRWQATRDAKAALALAEPWLKSHPADHGVRRLVVEVLVRMRSYAAARTELELVRRSLPGDAGVLNDLALVMSRLGDPAALDMAEQAVKAAPNNPAVMDTAGWVALSAGQPERAIQLLREARLRIPENPEVRYHLGAALVKTGRTAEARDELRAALLSKAAFDGRQDAEALLKTLN
jgi:putative PEP-CTERM system TPR-repeat lipoprotein